MKNSKGNVIAVTQFESYFAHYLVEHSDFFKSVFDKILARILVIEEANKENKVFQRMMFAVYSNVQEQFGLNSIETVIQPFNIFAAHYFIKLFCDYILDSKQLKIIIPIINEGQGVHVSSTSSSSSSSSNASALSQHTLFKPLNRNFKQLVAIYRIPELFGQNRGVVEDSEHIVPTQKLGITELEHTPENLAQYFKKPIEPTQYLYKPDRQSLIGRWFSKHNLPIISGSSGSICDTLALILLSLELTPDELKLFVVANAAVMTAQGHHSFFEIFIITERHFETMTLKSKDNMFDFYEQTLPKVITESESYRAFKESVQESKLLKGIVDDSTIELSEGILPDIRIGNNTAFRLKPS